MGRLGLAGALTGTIGIVVIAVGIVFFRPDDSGGDSGRPTPTAGDASSQRTLGSVGAPATGPVLNVTTPEGYGYGLAAVKAGTDDKPLDDSKPLTEPGTTYAYADYVLTNNQRRAALLDHPADLFMPVSQVPGSARERCMPQPGIPDDMCTLPNRSRVTARVNGSKPPISEAGDSLIPAGASYVVRIAAELPVKDGVKPEDLKLYVWDARFTSDRKGIEIAFP
ncbi:hypothetical protein GCM10010191_92710 [Actinomadura vinacea]|uniref:Uncharacterized protein n=1 Tax=Actinomadura vinacea TaxID=115336 RepID=A0ABP5XK59_9ACTN